MFTRQLTIDEYERVSGALDALNNVFGPGLFVGENLITADLRLGFMGDMKFRSAFERAVPTLEERGIVWRVHTIAWAARRAMALSGDFVDVGARQGLEAAVIGRYLDLADAPRKWVLFDSYDVWRFAPYPGGESAGCDLSQRTIDRVAFMPNAKVVKIASLLDLDADAPAEIAMLRVEDRDPSMITGAIAKLFPRICSGGALIIEGYCTMAGRGESLDRFLPHLDHPILELPTGQGLIIKR